MNFRHLAFAAACVAGLSVPALAETNVTILHVNEVAAAKALWDKIAADYNAAHQGVKVQFKYLENEAFKAKLPTMLQSDDSARTCSTAGPAASCRRRTRPGFSRTSPPTSRTSRPTMSPTAVDAFKIDGKVVGVPFEIGEVAFYYNKKLFAKAGVKAEDIKTWDDFLGAVKKLKAAGITPIVVGAGEKWPMHFYLLPISSCASAAKTRCADAKAGKNGGFKNAAFVEAGKRLHELAALEPFQPGYLQTSHAQSAGVFGDGKAAMDLMGQWLLGMQGPNSASGKGIAGRRHRHPVVPDRARRQGQGDRHAGRRQRLAGQQDARRRRRSTSSSSSARRNTPKEAAATGAYIPVVQGRRGGDHRPVLRRLADDLAATTYHQNYLRSGPRSVGRPRHQRHLGRRRRRAK